jgi:hypothetical protein
VYHLYEQKKKIGTTGQLVIVRYNNNRHSIPTKASWDSHFASNDFLVITHALLEHSDPHCPYTEGTNKTG